MRAQLLAVLNGLRCFSHACAGTMEAVDSAWWSRRCSPPACVEFCTNSVHVAGFKARVFACQVWIENLNTVLDDNKKLCLNSGEIIKCIPQRWNSDSACHDGVARREGRPTTGSTMQCASFWPAVRSWWPAAYDSPTIPDSMRLRLTPVTTMMFEAAHILTCICHHCPRELPKKWLHLRAGGRLVCGVSSDRRPPGNICLTVYFAHFDSMSFLISAPNLCL